MSLFGFENDDEIYSWNKWAIDFYLDRDITFQFTKWAYPLLFPRLLNLGYILNGSLKHNSSKDCIGNLPVMCNGCSGARLRESDQDPRRPNGFPSHTNSVRQRAKSSWEDGMPDTMAAAAVVISAQLV